jgi:hypothetical protein
MSAPPPVRPRDMRVLAYAQGFTLWAYAARADGPEILTATGWMMRAADMVTSGDGIHFFANSWSAFRTVRITGGVVTLEAPL